jgi:microcystin-dependent protein
MPVQLLSGTLPGVIHPYGSATAPTGWLLCNGQAVSRTTYAALFNVIGTAFGVGNGTTTFNVPDFQGRFLRGVANGTGRDPDVGSRGANGNGQTNAVGSTQSDAMQGHLHGPESGTSGYVVNGSSGWAVIGGGGQNFGTNTGSPVTDGSHGTPRTSTESRPANIYVNYIIKF